MNRPPKLGEDKPSPNKHQAKLGRAVGSRAFRRGEGGWEGLGGPLWSPNTQQPKEKPKEKAAKGRASRRGGRGVGRGWGPCGRPWVGNCDVQAKQGATAGGHKGPKPF